MIYKIEKIIFSGNIITNQNVDVRYKNMPIGSYIQCGFQELTIPFSGVTGQLITPIEIQCVRSGQLPTMPYSMTQGSPYQFAFSNDSNNIEQFTRIIQVPFQSMLSPLYFNAQNMPAPNPENNQVVLLGMPENGLGNTMQTQQNIITNLSTTFDGVYCNEKNSTTTSVHTGVSENDIINQDEWTIFMRLNHDSLSSDKGLIFAGDINNYFKISLIADEKVIEIQRKIAAPTPGDIPTYETRRTTVQFIEGDWYNLHIKKDATGFYVAIDDAVGEILALTTPFVASDINRIRMFQAETNTDFLETKVSDVYFYFEDKEDLRALYDYPTYSSYSLINDLNTYSMKTNYDSNGNMILTFPTSINAGTYSLLGMDGVVYSDNIKVEAQQNSLDDVDWNSNNYSTMEDKLEGANQNLLTSKEILVAEEGILFQQLGEYKVLNKHNQNACETIFKFIPSGSGKIKAGLFKKMDVYPLSPFYNAVNGHDVYEMDGLIKKINQFIGFEIDYDNETAVYYYKNGDYVVEEYAIPTFDFSDMNPITLSIDNRTNNISFALQGSVYEDEIIKQSYMSYEFGFEVFNSETSPILTALEIGVTGTELNWIFGSSENLNEIN